MESVGRVEDMIVFSFFFHFPPHNFWGAQNQKGTRWTESKGKVEKGKIASAQSGRLTELLLFLLVAVKGGGGGAQWGEAGVRPSRCWSVWLTRIIEQSQCFGAGPSGGDHRCGPQHLTWAKLNSGVAFSKCSTNNNNNNKVCVFWRVKLWFGEEPKDVATHNNITTNTTLWFFLLLYFWKILLLTQKCDALHKTSLAVFVWKAAEKTRLVEITPLCPRGSVPVSQLQG